LGSAPLPGVEGDSESMSPPICNAAGWCGSSVVLCWLGLRFKRDPSDVGVPDLHQYLAGVAAVPKTMIEVSKVLRGAR